MEDYVIQFKTAVNLYEWKCKLYRLLEKLFVTKLTLVWVDAGIWQRIEERGEESNAIFNVISHSLYAC